MPMNRFASDATPEELRETLLHWYAMQIKLCGMAIVYTAVAAQLRRLTETVALADAVSEDPEAASRLLHAATALLLNSQT
jgi:hypothetical protein